MSPSILNGQFIKILLKRCSFQYDVLRVRRQISCMAETFEVPLLMRWLADSHLLLNEMMTLLAFCGLKRLPMSKCRRAPLL